MCVKTKAHFRISANSLIERENNIVKAQTMVADMHNASGLTNIVGYKIERYFGRDIKVIFADKFAETTAENLKGTALENVPLIGTLSQFGGLSSFADEKEFYPQIMRLYGE